MEVIKKSTLGEVFAKRVSFQAGKGEKGREERERERERERYLFHNFLLDKLGPRNGPRTSYLFRMK